MKAYQLKITIKESKPPIWRRVIIPEKITFHQLHLTIQSVFCWKNYHLYEFEFPNEYIRVVDDIEESEEIGEFDDIDASEEIDELVSGNKTFKYVYDYGDYWEHMISVEKILTDYEARYPQVVKYKGDVIPEDCGGIWGYYDLINKLEDKGLDEYSELNAWAIGQGFGSYNMDEVNEHMKKQLIFPKTKKSVRAIKPETEVMLNGFKDFMNSKETTNLFKESFLEEIYDCYSKNEIVDIAKIHHVPRYSKLKKDELIPYVVDYILSEDEMKRYFMFMQDSEIEIFENKIKKDIFIPFEMAEECYYLFDGGYCGLTNEFGVVIPKDVMNAYIKIDTKEFHKRRKRLCLIGNYCNGANNLYAVTPISIILELFNKYEKNKLNENELLDAYYEMKRYRCDFTYIDGMFIDDSLIEDNVYQMVYRELGNIPYYMSTREEILSLGKYNHDVITDKHYAIYDFILEKMGVEEDEASFACYQIQENIRNGYRTQAIIDDLRNLGVVFQSYKQLEEFTKILMDLWNNSRMILNRGYTPNELARIESPKKLQDNVIEFSAVKRNKKIYPNDPCPCGSGKKYKICCGKNTDN